MKKLILVLALTFPFLAQADADAERLARIEQVRAARDLPSTVEAGLVQALTGEGLEPKLAKEAAHLLLLPETAGVSADIVIRDVVVYAEIEKLRASAGDPAEVRAAIEERFRALDFAPGEAEFMARKALAVPSTTLSVRKIVGETLAPKPVSGRTGTNVIEFRPRPRGR